MNHPAFRRLSFTTALLIVLAGVGRGAIESKPESPSAQTATASNPALSSTEKYTSLPAFPGAEGYGMYVTGGRGGSVYEVTNTKDYNPRTEAPIPGSLRDAVSQGNRTIVFRVSGTITLGTPLNIAASNITIAGQTAPGDGICTKDSPVGITGHNIIIRYLRCRLGDENREEADALDVNNGASNVILDHCSATWSVDECLSLAGNESMVTVQWCIIGESLNHSIHAKGPHGYGSLSRSNGNVSWLYNIWIDNNARNPRLDDNYGRGAGPTFEVRNNLMYNYGDICSGLTQGYLTVNYINNYIKPGPASSAKTPIHTPPAPGGDAMPSDMTYYLKGNIFEGNETLTKSNNLFFDNTAYPNFLAVHFSDQPVAKNLPPYRVVSAEDSYKAILEGVGATLPVRDRVDAGIVNQVRTNTGKIINSQNEVGGWPELKSASAPVDTDHDGIPDAWETADGLKPDDAADGAKIGPNGYTYLEEYLNGTDPRIKTDYLDPKNNISSLKVGPSQPLWVPPATATDATTPTAAK